MSRQYYRVVHLSQPPTKVYCGDGDLKSGYSEWVQDPGMWSLFYYHHSNAVTIDGAIVAVEPDDVVLIHPGAACSHARFGTALEVEFITFDLPGTAGIQAALPRHLKGQSAWLAPWRTATGRIVDSISPVRSFTWYFLWTISRRPGVSWSDVPIRAAEAFIQNQLAMRFSVGDVADAAGVSPRKLLEMFRQTHGVTVQDYIQRQRAQEAARLLLKSDLTIKQVAAKVGVFDSQRFNKLMRAMTGLPPRRYRAVGRHR